MKQTISLCIVVTSFSLAVLAQAPESWKPFGNLTAAAFVNELKSLSGDDGIDCGISSLNKPDRSLAACGQEASKNHKGFFLGYVEDGARLLRAGYGVAEDASGDVFVVNYQWTPTYPAVQTRHSRVADDSHTRITECVKPVNLATTSAGMLACVLPINLEESERAAHQSPIGTSVCAVLDSPAAWNNKLVRIQGEYSGNFEYSGLSDRACKGALWFEYGGGDAPPSLAAYVGGGARPGSEDADGKLILPMPMTVVRDEKFAQFEKQVEAMAKADDEAYKKNPDKFVGYCVTATFTGRVDTVPPEIRQFHKTHPKQSETDFSGFGQMGQFDGQFTLQSVNSDSVLSKCPE